MVNRTTGFEAATAKMDVLLLCEELERSIAESLQRGRELRAEWEKVITFTNEQMAELEALQGLNTG